MRTDKIAQIIISAIGRLLITQTNSLQVGRNPDRYESGLIASLMLETAGDSPLTVTPVVIGSAVCALHRPISCAGA